MSEIPFTHLHVHSQYSLLDGKATIPELVDKAIADGQRGIALTDHGNMFGIKEFFNYVEKKNSGCIAITGLLPRRPKIRLPLWPSTVDTGKLGISV